MVRDMMQREPPSAMVIRAAAASMRRHRSAVVLLALAVTLACSLLSGLYTVGNGESAAVRRLGALADDAVGPGLHLRLPWGIDRVTTVNTGNVFRVEVAGDVLKQLQLVTGDENLIDITLVVQYKVTRSGDYLFRVENPELLVTQAVRAALVDAVAGSAVDDVLTAGKAEVQNRVRTHAQAMLQAYGTGLTLVGVNLQTVTPPLEAAPAFREVNDAKAEAARAVNDAETKRERDVAFARGEAGKVAESARAAAAARVQQARGATERFRELLERHRVIPAQTRTDLYMDTVKRVLPRAKVVVLAPGQKPKIDLNLIQRGTATGAPPPADGVPPPPPGR